MKRSLVSLVLGCCAVAAHAQFTLGAKTGFGTDGYLGPGGASTASFLANDNNARGLAYNRATGNVYVVSRTSALGVYSLDGQTGAQNGTFNVSGISGGTFAANMIGVSNDGQIYATNLTTDASTTAFKLYKWKSEIDALNSSFAVMQTLFSSTTGPRPNRLGDSLDVTGQGNQVSVVAGYNGTTGYLVLNDTGAATASTTDVAFGSGTSSGDFRLGVTFAGNSSTVLGSQGGSTSASKYTTYSGGTGTLVNATTLTSTSERAFDYTVWNGTEILATLDSASSLVRVYNFTSKNAPVLLASKTVIPSTSNANSNGTGAIAFGASTSDSLTIYAMNTNNGVQALTLTAVPEPGTIGAIGMGVIGLLARKRRK